MDYWLNPTSQDQNTQLQGWFSNYCEGTINVPLDYAVCETWFWVNKSATNGTFEPPWFIANEPYPKAIVKLIIERYVNGVLGGECPEFNGKDDTPQINYLVKAVNNPNISEGQYRAVFYELRQGVHVLDGSRASIYPCVLYPVSAPNCKDKTAAYNQQMNNFIAQQGISDGKDCNANDFWCNLSADIRSLIIWTLVIGGVGTGIYLYFNYSSIKSKIGG
ncbi:MAG: hypothetical protein NT007_09525 [Candidatus Kapabacteria bacterium]|nr:hypothetical protein [Candidatus Kapabacteria bacterium]